MSKKIINAGAYVQSIHTTISNRFKETKDEEQAKIIERYLQRVKKKASSFPKGGAKSADAIVGQAEDAYAKVVTDATKTLGFDANNRLFRRTHSSAKRLGDDIFEDELAAVLSVTLKDLQYKKLVQGFNKGTVYTADFFKDLDDVVGKRTFNKFSEKLKQSLMTKMAPVSVKTDIGIANKEDGYVMNIDIKDEDLVGLADALNGATFSAKNYKTYHSENGKWKQYRNIEDIDLGLGEAESSLFKSVTGGMYEAKIEAETAVNLYYAGLMHLTNRTKKRKNEKTIRTHFSHLRFIFELRGSGFVVNGKIQPPTKFFVYNNPTGDEIYVRSTAAIANEVIKQDPLDFLGKKISYNAAKTKSNK